MTYRKHMHEASRKYVTDILAIAGGSVNRAAKLAGCNRTYFYTLLTKHGLLTKLQAKRMSGDDSEQYIRRALVDSAPREELVAAIAAHLHQRSRSRPGGNSAKAATAAER